LSQAQIPVPQFVATDPKAGVILMEDLGDVLLQNRIQANPQEKEIWLSRAVELLSQLHSRLFPVPQELPAHQRSFDGAKYFEELSFTFKHLREGFLGLAPLKASQLQEVKNFCEALAQSQPLVFSHRDYHCRNLMVHSDQLFMIDFQDARLGPPAYDLASLLFDAYLPISEPLRESLIAQYLKDISQSTLGQKVAPSTMKEDLFKVAFQRTLKAAGSFASFWTRFQKKTHLVYIEPALKLTQSIETFSLIPENVRSAVEVDKMLEALYAKKTNH